MKKLLLLSTAAALSISAFAQSGGRSIMLDGGMEFKTPVNTVKPGALPPSPAQVHAAAWSKGAKKTFSGGQYFSHFDFVNALLGNPFSSTSGQTVLQPIWFDSTVTQRFSTGYGTINYSAAAANIDPLSSVYSSDTDLVNQVYGLTSGAGNLMKVDTGDSYQIDSVYITGAYVIEKPSRTTFDSLIVSVVPTGGYYYFVNSTSPWITNYGVATTDTLRGYAPLDVDSIRRTITSYTSGINAVTWVVPLDPTTMGSIPSPTDGSVTLHNFAWAPPGGPLTIPKGHSFAISVTFKSTDTWTPHVDSVNEFNRFMPLWGYEFPYPAGGYMTYWRNTYSHDRNMGDLMFSTDSSQFLPVLPIQGWNLPNSKFFSYEYPAMGAWIECSSCRTIAQPTAVNNVVNTISGVSVYPNPANDQVAISYRLSQQSDVTVTLSNTLGQVVASQNMNNGKLGTAIMNTSNLANGVYFYTVIANGERSTGRVAITH
ncbi:MAG: T9SS type A sorting domain-containing protein [Flavipsychrobacter sp.]